MQAHVTTDFASYDAAVAAFLARDPVGNTVLLTIAGVLRAGGSYDAGEPWFAWVTDDDGAAVGAVARTPPYLVAVAAMPDGPATALGAALSGHDLLGAVGSPDAVAAFARGAGRRHTVRMREVQHVLREVVRPAPVEGEARHYTPEDGARYVAWMEGFHAEAGLLVHGDAMRSLAQRLSTGGALWLWWVGSEPVCMVGRSAPVAGVPRIGPVWTPPEHRRRGYAAALTAHVCTGALAAGASACTLFADEANATANGVYRRIGFTPAARAVEAVFHQS
ncbi:MAG: hypothetical protein QOF18_2336 [Frankiaceae bacterium]|jgi:GNAT superfamily N-acetyltransferase|nr:hypothetical protein [Frankiaceae bacterium]